MRASILSGENYGVGLADAAVLVSSTDVEDRHADPRR
jgi:hypothetical protein